MKKNFITIRILLNVSTKQKDRLKNNESISINEKKTQNKQKKTFSKFNKITTKIRNRAKKKKNKDKAVSENKTDTIQKVKKFKKKLLTIEYKFTSYILKKMKAREKKRSRDSKQMFEINSNITNFRNFLLKEENLFENNDIFNNTLIKNFNEYVAFKKHKRKTVTRNIAVRNFEIIKNVLKEEKLNDDELIKLDRCLMSKKVR